MTRPEEIQGYEVPLHMALTQPILMGGAPRTFAILNGTVTLVVGMGLHLWWLGFPVGIASATTAPIYSTTWPTITSTPSTRALASSRATSPSC